MRTILLRFVVFCVVAGMPPASGDVSTVVGFWEQVGEDGRVGGWFLFDERDGIYSGRLVKMFSRQGEAQFDRCIKCSGRRKNAPMLGLPIVTGMKRIGLKYVDGTILDPRDGAVYDAEMEMTPDGKKLSVRGFLGLPIFGQTQVWRRLPDNAMMPSEIPKG